MAGQKTVIMDADGIRRALTRIAFEIIEKNKGAEHLLLAGIRTRGIYLAQRIAQKLGEVEGTTPPVIELDVTPWRDDMPRQDAPMPSPDARIEGATVVLVDDVLYTGRTVRAAIEAVSCFGRASRIQLAVLPISRRSGRPRPPRAPHPPGLYRQKPADLARGKGLRPPPRGGRGR